MSAAIGSRIGCCEWRLAPRSTVWFLVRRELWQRGTGRDPGIKTGLGGIGCPMVFNENMASDTFHSGGQG